MKGNRLALVLGLVIALGLGLTLAVAAEGGKADPTADKAQCALKLRFGQEAFDRGQYAQAKGYFREAVQADPSSAKAWAFYDLSVMYAMAEQVKNAGSVKVSDAPTPDSLKAATPPAASGGAPAPAAPTTAAPPAPTAAPPPAAAPPGIPAIKPDEGC